MLARITARCRTCSTRRALSTSSLFDDSALSSLKIDESDGGSSSESFLHKKPHKIPTPPIHMAHRLAMKQEFPDGWAPPRKLSREAMEGLRQLHNYDPRKFNTPALADEFKISPEAVSKILKSKWQPSSGQRGKLSKREQGAREERKLVSRVEESRAMSEVDMQAAPQRRPPREERPSAPEWQEQQQQRGHVGRGERRILNQRDGPRPVRGFRDARTNRVLPHPNPQERRRAFEEGEVRWKHVSQSSEVAKGVDENDRLSF